MTHFIRRSFSLISVLVGAATLPACSEPPWEGTSAKVEAAAFEAAFMRAVEAGAGDPDCLDADIEFRFSLAKDWTHPGLRGATESDGRSWWRSEIMVEFTDGTARSAEEVDEILTHEFLHAMLECGGADWSENVLHQGDWWKGLVRR